jgi:predicted nuclease with TOPRIM domain
LTFFVRFYILLGFLNNLILYAKRKRSEDDIGEDVEDDKQDKNLKELEESQSDLKDIRAELEEVRKAKDMENSTLPSSMKSNNGHLRNIEKNYPEFFDKEDNSQTTNNGLNNVEEYLKEQEKEVISRIKELSGTPNQALDDLPSEAPSFLDDGE